MLLCESESISCSFPSIRAAAQRVNIHGRALAHAIYYSCFTHKKEADFFKYKVFSNGDDDDLAGLKNDKEFLTLKRISQARYANAVSRSNALFSWKKKTADSLFLAIHGNTQNGWTAQADWAPIVGRNSGWQIETVQSAEPDGYGTYRWRRCFWQTGKRQYACVSVILMTEAA